MNAGVPVRVELWWLLGVLSNETEAADSSSEALKQLIRPLIRPPSLSSLSLSANRPTVLNSFIALRFSQHKSSNLKSFWRRSVTVLEPWEKLLTCNALQCHCICAAEACKCPSKLWVLKEEGRYQWSVDLPITWWPSQIAPWDKSGLRVIFL